MDLYDAQGARLYLTQAERRAFLAVASGAEGPLRTFCTVLHNTGCRVSEVLAVRARDVDFADQALIEATLKKRSPGHYRAVPLPARTLDLLALVHGLNPRARRRGRSSKRNEGRLWPWHRATAWRQVTALMEEAGIAPGPHRTPKGLRHGYGVHAISCGVPLNLLSKWMGHASLEVTAIYANALGEEQRNIAARMWT